MDGEVVRISGIDLLDDEVQQHFESGKCVSNIDVDWDSRLSFTLTADLALKRIRMSEALIDDLDTDLEDPAARLDAEFALFSGQMRELIAGLDAVFGLTDAEQRAAA